MAQNILIKGLSFSFDNTDNQDRYIQVYYKDTSNKYVLHKTTDNKLEFIKIVNGVTNTLISSTLTFSKFQTFNIFVSIDSEVGTNVSYLINNGTVITLSNADKTVINGDVSLYLHNNDGTKQCNAFMENVYFFKDKSFDTDDISVMLRGRNTIVGKETDVHLNEVADMFKTPLLQNGFILPNNKYTLTGEADLYCNNVLTRRVATGVFITTGRENKIEIINNAECKRLD